MSVTPAVGPGTELPSDLRADRHPSGRSNDLPARFGRYLLVEHLAEGGMADVYRAIAPGAAGVSKAVCIKRIRAGRLEDPRLVSLFIDEARVSMQLSHVNIVHTYDFGRVGDEYFLALEFVDGVDLASVLEPGGPLDPEAVAAVGEALCRALAHVHSRRRPDGAPMGLVHRDVTPRNVLVTVEGDVKLADFGVARIRSGKTEGLRGTLAYMSPEQARGGVVDATSDLFGVGLVLYECLHGRPAYVGGHETVLELARRGEVEIDAGTSPLDAAIARAVALEPSCRYPDAASMADDLGRIVARGRAAGGGDPRATLAARVEKRARLTATDAPPDAPADHRPAAYYTEDGNAPDFAARLGATELSQAGTLAGAGVARPGWLGRTRAVVAIVLALAVGAVSAVLLMSTASHSLRAPGDAGGHRPRAAVRGIGGAVARPPGGPASETTADALPRAAPAPLPEEPSRVARGQDGRAGAGGRVAAALRSGTLDLNALPWAEATIDGVPRGTTPLRDLRLAAGRHRIRLENDAMGVRRWVVVSLEPDERRTVVVDLRTGSGSDGSDGTELAPPGAGSSP